METKRVFLAALLSMAVLIAWQAFFPAKTPPPPNTAAPEALEAPAFPRASESEPADNAFSAPARVAEPAADPGAPASGNEVLAVAEETVVLEVETVRAEFTNRGAQLVSFVLKQHPDADGNPVDMIRRRSEAPYPFALNGPERLNEALFQVELGESGESVRFEYAGPAGQARKDFRLGTDGLLEVGIAVAGRSDWGIWIGPGIRNPSQQEQDARFAGRSAVYSLGGDIEREDSLRLKEPLVIEGSGLSWIGLQDTYFLGAWLADSPIAQAHLLPVVHQPEQAQETGGLRYIDKENGVNGEEKAFAREQVLVVYPGADRLEGRVFLGAKEYDRLASFGLEKTVNLGIFWFIARPMLWGLRWIHDNLVGNYGWAIVLMTVLIRILLFPLTHKGFLSMQKMQRLNPKMQAIRQQYRPKLKDKRGRPNPEAQRKMNEEIMALYKSEGVNPAGGCLPMILQIPVFFAFYNLLSSAFELRFAPWVGWIHDLSAMDPFYVLPIVMGVAMLAQQKLMPSTGDPMQRRLMMFMPFFITFICLKLPSGLALYWTTSNLLGILQQAFYSRIRDDSKNDQKPEKAKRKART